MLSRKPTTLCRRPTKIAAALAAAAIAIGGGAYGIVSATASTGSGAAPAATFSAASGQSVTARGGGSNARSGPAAGGSSGTVDSVSKSSFTISTAAAQKVTVNKAPSTRYEEGTRLTSASAVTKGDSVLVVGIASETTITASQVIVQPADGAGSTASSEVVPFQRGAPSTSKEVGEIPAAYSQGSGTIVSGTAADKATTAALAAYPGASSTVS
jgi:Domain of unknown function (DUF5666)